MTDADGRTYIDYVGSWGPMILGHADAEVVAALREALARGTSYGAPTELEIEMAEEIVDAVPSIEMVRMVNSGTEATMSALRLARGVTGRDQIVKFEGCYHGHGDSLLVKAGSGVATLGPARQPRRPATVAANTHHRALQRRGSARTALRRARRDDRRRHRRAGRRQHGLRRRRARASSKRCASSRGATARCSSSTR